MQRQRDSRSALPKGLPDDRERKVRYVRIVQLGIDVKGHVIFFRGNTGARRCDHVCYQIGDLPQKTKELKLTEDQHYICSIMAQDAALTAENRRFYAISYGQHDAA